MSLLERDYGWLAHPSDDRPGERVDHPAVVLRVTPLGAIIIHGTRTPRDREGRRLAQEDVPAEPDGRVFWVEPTSDDGRVMSLTARTFFCRTGAGFYRDPRDLRVIARCPNGLFLELRRIAGVTA